MTTTRKGSANRADIPADVLAQLHAGTLETATLAEGLAIDFALLLANAVPDLPAESHAIVAGMAGQGVTRRMETAAALLLAHLGVEGLSRIAKHPSDTVRGWACFAIGLAPKLKLKPRLELIRPLADDPHFGVREWAWMPMRDHVRKNVTHAVAALKPWVKEESPFLRRFAVELTRPRGVWTGHVEQLKLNPELALPLLEPLKADLEKYVQDSVANWLNDAGKSQPTWVKELVTRWRKETNNHPATDRIIARATRNL
ncbi:DNA alkylation repair protein [Limnoglobus roseus]|uniref:DNA alkylation repair protein n=1 Tax=Limnoglobus roseus TaxID=2598579 RepID=A0A5C1A884_9BACT|nr:DNA alkylation repair protein [Limnoglobus roseus]QEL15421.1 DNA alkylation repair protein [Limnoglobus roseus]